MIIRYKAFILPHLGDPYRLCADRFSIGEKEKAFAISDGVSNSLFPEVWAKLLCDDYVQTPGDFICDNCLCREKELIDSWERIRGERVDSFTSDELFIYNVGLDKADFAAATFVGLRLSVDKWYCWALGDSYLGILDKDYNIVKHVTSMSGKPFDYYPEYFASKKGRNNGVPISDSGSIKDGRFFILMSDAVSEWFFSEDRTNDQRKALLDIGTHEEYELFIGNLRSTDELKDDDTSIVVLTLDDDDSSDISFEQLEVDNIEDFIQNDEQAPGEEASDSTDVGNHDSDENSSSTADEEPRKESDEDSSKRNDLEMNNINESSQAAVDEVSVEKGVHERLADTDVAEEKQDEGTPENIVVLGKEDAEIEKLHIQYDKTKNEILTLNERIQEMENRINELTQQIKQLEDYIV